MGGLRACEQAVRLLRPPLEAQRGTAPCHARPATAARRRPASARTLSLRVALLLVLLTPALASAANPQPPAVEPRIDPELLLFLAEFADAEGELLPLELLDQAAEAPPEQHADPALPAEPAQTTPAAAPDDRATAEPTPARRTPRGDTP